MLSGIVKCNRLIEVGSAFCDVARIEEGEAHKEMPDHERGGIPVFTCEPHKLRC